MKKKNAVVTIGVFDGVHIGHAAIIKRVVKRARSEGLKSIVVTFDPHPLKVLRPSHFVPSLISLKHRVGLIEEFGIDEVIVMKFNKRMANCSAERFIEDILIKRLCVRDIIVGEDFHFGKEALAGGVRLREIAGKNHIKVEIIKPVKKRGQIISSTAIRRLILEGRINEASIFLGRPFSVLGTVARGTKLARTLGYPTANINPHHEVIPPSGVYAVRVMFMGKMYKGMINIGVRPTFYSHGHDKEPTIEVNIFNFHKRIYGRDIEIIFVQKIRGEKKFRTIDSLIEQIRKDKIKVDTLL